MVPDSAPGKIQQIIDDAQVDANLAADQLVLIDSLDHEAYVRQLIAPKLACEKYLDEIFYDHKRESLNPKLDLEYLNNKAVLFWNQAYLVDDQKAMELLEDLQADIAAKQGLMQPPAPAPEQMPPMPAPGAEMATPGGVPISGPGPMPPPPGMAPGAGPLQ
jgi:hypothetical protein